MAFNPGLALTMLRATGPWALAIFADRGDRRINCQERVVRKPINANLRLKVNGRFHLALENVFKL